MQFERTELEGLFIITPEIHIDDRGYFFESFNQKKFDTYMKTSFIQDNESKSSFGTLRGLHIQKPPYTQAKLVRVVTGKVLDLILDLRVDSKTFGKHLAIILSQENKRQIFVPRGFAHGFIVLSQEAIFTYKVDNIYNRDSEFGISYNDLTLNIDWIISPKEIQVSAKDSTLPNFNNSCFYSTNEYNKTI